MSHDRVLIVEDDSEMAELLANALREDGFDCGIASNGQAGLSMAANFDLLLVDAMMPVMNGFVLVERLRQSGYLTPVLFLTARDSTKDVVRGLGCGADDYIVKPFKLEELIARIHAALRRSKIDAPVLRWNDLVVDCRKRTAFIGKREMFLSPTEFSLLELFVRRPGVILSKETILNQIWQSDGSRDENIVELYVNYLRRKTEVSGQQRILQTVRKRGYVLATNELES